MRPKTSFLTDPLFLLDYYVQSGSSSHKFQAEKRYQMQNLDHQTGAKTKNKTYEDHSSFSLFLPANQVVKKLTRIPIRPKPNPAHPKSITTQKKNQNFQKKCSKSEGTYLNKIPLVKGRSEDKDHFFFFQNTCQ